MSIDYRVLGDPFHDNALYTEINTGQTIHRIMFDCGEHCLDPLRPADIMDVDHLCFSHFHLDHIAGFDTFIRMNYNRESKPVRIWGPENAPEIIRHRLQGITWDRIQNSPGKWIISGIEHEKISSKTLYAHEEFKTVHSSTSDPRNETIYSNRDYTLQSTILSHRTPSIAYRITETPDFIIDKTRMNEAGLSPGPWASKVKDLTIQPEQILTIEGKKHSVGELRDILLKQQRGQSVAYATDYILEEESVQKLTDMIQGCDVFVSEATYVSEENSLAAEHYHMTARQVAEIAQNAQVEELVLIHYSKRYQKAGFTSIIQEARTFFPNTKFPVQWSD